MLMKDHVIWKITKSCVYFDRFLVFRFLFCFRTFLHKKIRFRNWPLNMSETPGVICWECWKWCSTPLVIPITLNHLNFSRGRFCNQHLSICSKGVSFSSFREDSSFAISFASVLEIKDEPDVLFPFKNGVFFLVQWPYLGVPTSTTVGKSRLPMYRFFGRASRAARSARFSPKKIRP